MKLNKDTLKDLKLIEIIRRFLDERDKRDSMRQDYESKLQRQQNSSLKGKDGEGMVYSRLNMMFPTADVEDTHTIPHRGDFILRVEGMTVMIETKTILVMFRKRNR